MAMRTQVEKKMKKKIAPVFHSTTFVLVNSNRKQTHKGEANATAPDSLFAFKPMTTIEKPVLDQTIPLRVPAAIKTGLIALAIADGRSLNNWLNLRFAEMVKANALPMAAHNPQGLLGEAETARLACQNSVLDLDAPVQTIDEEWHKQEAITPTPHKATIKTKAKAKAKAKAKPKAKAKAKK